MHTSGVNFPTFQLAPHTHHPPPTDGPLLPGPAGGGRPSGRPRHPRGAGGDHGTDAQVGRGGRRGGPGDCPAGRGPVPPAPPRRPSGRRGPLRAGPKRPDPEESVLVRLGGQPFHQEPEEGGLRRPAAVRRAAAVRRNSSSSSVGGGENSRPGVGVPPRYRDASDAVRSYRRHVALLAEGGPPVPAADGGRREAAEALCEELAARARAALREAGGGGGGGGGLEGNGGAYDRIEADLAEAERARALLFGGAAGGSRRRRRRPPSAAAAGGAAPAPAPAPAPAASSGGSGSGSASSCLRVQDAHLDALSSNLVELAGIGEALGTSFASQAVLVDALADKSDALAERTKEVRRRAERRAAAARWVRERPTLTGGWVTVRHAASGLYLRCESRGATVALGPTDPDGGGHVFGVWSRRGSAVIGLRGRRTRTYLGQSLLGYLVCSAARYGRAEEWELDGDASGPGGGVAILCVGANWGSGGWLEANPAAGTVQVGGSSGPAARKRAALWRVDQVEAGGDS